MCERWTHQSGSPSLFDLPHTDDVSHFVQDESFDIAIRFHFTYVEYVEGHFPCETDGWTGTPNTGRSCEAEYVVSVRTPCTVDSSSVALIARRPAGFWTDPPQGTWVITSDHLHK